MPEFTGMSVVPPLWALYTIWCSWSVWRSDSNRWRSPIKDLRFFKWTECAKVKTTVRCGKNETNTFKSCSGSEIDVLYFFNFPEVSSSPSPILLHVSFYSIRLDKKYGPEDAGSYLSGSSKIRYSHLFHIIWYIFKYAVLLKCASAFYIWLYCEKYNYWILCGAKLH